MIGGITLLGGLPDLPGRVTLSAAVAFWHVNVSRLGNPVSRGRVHVICASALETTPRDPGVVSLHSCAESKPRRRMIDSGRLFDVERQSWLAELRQNFAPISCFIGHTTWKFS